MDEWNPRESNMGDGLGMGPPSRPSQPRSASEERLKALWAIADAFIADLSDEDIVMLKDDVLAGRPDLVSVLKNRDPRTSATLRGLIYERATGKRVAV
jgi:hypothetical protein